MGWYKNKIKIDFEERNRLNHNIKFLEYISSRLEKLSKIIFQNTKFAKNNVLSIINDKKMTSYPFVRDILIEANEISLDNPWKFAILLKEAKDIMDVKIGMLKKQRREMTSDNNDKKWKGLI